MFKAIENIFTKFQGKTEEELALVQVQLEQLEKDEAYRCMNNLYLELERGDVEMNLNLHLALRTLVYQAYDRGDFMIDWWIEEFQKLPNWLDF